MLLKTEIYNRNYYPIRIFKVDNTVLSEDKISKSQDWTVNATSFDNKIGMLIKPFQSNEWISSIALKEDVDKYKGHIYFDQTISTDSQDYGKFGILTAWDVDVQHHFVTLRVSDESPIIFTNDDIENLDNNYEMNIKFSMKDISDWNVIFKHLNTIGFDDYIIEKYDFVTDGIHYIVPHALPVPESCNRGILKRGNVIDGLSNDDLITKATTYLSKYKIYKDDENNVWFDMLVNKN